MKRALVQNQSVEPRLTLGQFVEKLSSAYEAFSASDSAQPSAVFCLMLDHWKRLREQYGYKGLLSLLEQILAELASNSDVEVLTCPLNERGVVAFLPQCSLKTAERQAEKLFRHISQNTFAIEEATIALSVSLVYLEFDHRFASDDQLLVNLVRSAEELSAAGGNLHKQIVPEVSVSQAHGDDAQMLGLLMESLRTDKLKVLFQPLMSTAGELSKTFQMLPRLVATDGSLIPASSFISVAREARVLGILDRWMIQRAIRLLTDDYHLQPVRFFLSQGDSLLVNPERRDWLRKLIEKNPSISGKLVLDFSLADALSNLNSTSEFLALLDELGIEVCFSRVDEHSKWDLLRDKLKVDYIKMAPNFVERLGQDPGLGHEFAELSAPVRKVGTKIIMPMVEDAGIAANIWRTGADYMQGYMIQEETEGLDMGN